MVLLFALAAISGLFVVWSVIADVLSVDRGLDITDEGIYLLSADPPNARATWLFPFGWHSGPLFRLVDFDIARFRTLGAVILVGTSALLGWTAVSVARSTSRPRLRDPIESSGSRRSFPTLGALVGGLGALLYYASFLRTPSYNWVNLTGITIAAGAQILLAHSLREGGYRRLISWAFAATAAFGFFYAFPAKPSTPIFMAILGFGLIAIVAGRVRTAAVWTGAQILATGGWLVAAVVIGWWPLDFVSVFLRVLERPILADTQTVAGAVRSLLSVPLAPWEAFITQGSATNLVIGLGLGAVCLIVGTWAAITTRPAPWMWRASCLGLVAASLLLAAIPARLPNRSIVSHWAYGPLVTACGFIIAAALIYVVARNRVRPTSVESTQSSVLRSSATGNGQESVAALSPTRFAVPAYLVFLPFVFSFGSSWGAYDQAANAAAILLIAAVAIVSLDRPERTAVRAGVAVALLTLVFAVVTLYESRQNPYRIPPIVEQVLPVAIGSAGHDLLLDADLAAVLTEIGEGARESGWSTDTPLVGLQWRWSTTVPYFLGARVPDSLMLTIFGYTTTVDRAAFSLEDPDSTFPYGGAWVIATTPDVLGDFESDQVMGVAETLAEKSGRPFPDGYECVAEVASFQLWRPLLDNGESRQDTSGECLTAPGISSEYDASFGWQHGEYR